MVRKISILLEIILPFESAKIIAPISLTPSFQQSWGCFIVHRWSNSKPRGKQFTINVRTPTSQVLRAQDQVEVSKFSLTGQGGVKRNEFLFLA
jgi:hypothetical protein